MPRLPLVMLGAALAAPSFASADSEPPAGARVLYQETFDRGTHSNGWFAFGGGGNITHRWDVIPFAGPDSSNAFVFSANAEEFKNYWFGGIGRNGLVGAAKTPLERLFFSMDLAFKGTAPASSKEWAVEARFLQGSTAKPTWSTAHRIVIDRSFRTVRLCLGEGRQSGAFSPDQPIHLHAITFGHGSFGRLADVQIVVDNPRLYALPE